MRHANLSIFVPHAGCPHQCSFCNQREISGTETPPDGKAVRALCEESEPPPGIRAEIAFFGGSFTALPRAYMVELLEAAYPFIEAEKYAGIRVSTRPDAINAESLVLLRRFGVTAVELGAQSMDDLVLQKNGRGHLARDVEIAARQVREAGFELGLQMMTGLYGADEETDRETARALAALEPDTVRIYPTLCIEGTRLAKLWRAGKYRPQALGAAVELTAELLAFFEEKGIRVIRVGLHAEKTLERGLLAGPYHPAFRELCEGRTLRDRLERMLLERPPGDYRLYLKNPSKITGHGAPVLAYLREMGYNVKVSADTALSGDAVRLLPD